MCVFSLSDAEINASAPPHVIAAIERGDANYLKECEQRGELNPNALDPTLFQLEGIQWPIWRASPIQTRILLTAIYFDQPDCMEVLVNAGADMEYAGDSGLTELPLCAALKAPSHRCFVRLLELGAKPNPITTPERPFAGPTPLAIAISMKNVLAVDELLKWGADVDASCSCELKLNTMSPSKSHHIH